MTTPTEPLIVVPETHNQGMLSIENAEMCLAMNRVDIDVGLQTSADGRIWICLNGVAFLRFKPHRKERHSDDDSIL